MLANAPLWLQQWARSRNNTARSASAVELSQASASPVVRNSNATAEPDALASVTIPPWLNGRFQRDLVSAAQAGINDDQWTPELEASVRSALKFIPASDWHTWFRVGAALHSTGWLNAREIWDEWSRSCAEKFNEADQNAKWEYFGRPRTGASVTLRTIFRMAYERGWRESSTPEQSDATVSGTAASGEQESQATSSDANSTSAKDEASGSPKSDIDDDDEIRRLATLSLLEYERERKAAAERLSVRATILDRLVAAERGELRVTINKGTP